MQLVIYRAKLGWSVLKPRHWGPFDAMVPLLKIGSRGLHVATSVVGK